MEMAAIPYEITNMVDINPNSVIPVPVTLLTSMFIHGNLFHLGGNMLYLWIFGNNIEDAMGHLRFVVFYVICGIVATLFHVASNPASKVPMVGASGAISGILGAYLLLYPWARVHTIVFIIFFIKIIKIPAFFLLTFWFVMQVLNSSVGGGVAWYAHIGGFLAGFILIKPFAKRKKRKSIRRKWG